MGFVTQSDYNRIAQFSGKEAADRYVKQHNIEVVPDPIQVQPVKAVGGANMEPDFSVADEDAADNTANEAAPSSLSVPKKNDAYSDWETRQSQYLKDLSAQRQQQLADAKAYIEKNYRGPSLSEQLFAISQALLSPTSMPGFKGVMANMAPAFTDIAKAQRTANQQRAEALYKLQQQYEQGAMDERGDVLKNELDLIKARAAAGKPRYMAVPAGGRLVNINEVDEEVPTNFGVLTPAQVIELRKDPANHGKTFLTTDNRPMEL